MNVNLTIKNYRCFADTTPCNVELRNGFTAFLGANNSGKSSLLKFFYEFRDVFSQLSSAGGSARNSFRGQEQPFSIQPTIFDKDELFTNSNMRGLTIILHLPEASGMATSSGLPLANRLEISVDRMSGFWKARPHVGNSPIAPSGDLVIDATTLRRGDRPTADIGLLMETSKVLSSSLYIGAFRNAINVGGNRDYYDIHVGQAFIEAWRRIKTGKLARQNEMADVITEDIRRILGFRKLEINASDDGLTLQLFINSRSYKLPEVGAGLAQLILVLINAATRRPSLLLFDEPELNLHPALQLDFLTTLGAYCTEGVLFSTHSVGLARAVADRIYVFRSKDENKSEVHPYEATPALSEILGELSFSSYRELGAEKILLVEGPTDIRTIHHFLRLYDKDDKIVLVQLGGRQLINEKSDLELTEFTRLCGSVYALIDSERVSEGAPISPEREGFRRKCQKVGITCHVLDRRATENYLSSRAVAEVFGNKYRGLAPFESLRDLSPSWSKADNWRIARVMVHEEIEHTDLGHFLASL